MLDDFANHAVGLTAPAAHAAAITPSDTVDLPHATRALYVGQTGNVRLRTVEDDVVTLANVQGGIVYPVRITQVFQTGTTASDLVGLS